ncbi:MAG: prolipoprotein diacylglyceryl transferase [Candidatus Omnitrophica bacterium]|nr:prolipoprotein diacylglyceryl transferase [Candidatus Omnitrophota bacterium]
MWPTFFSIGPLHLYSYGSAILVGLVISLVLMLRRARKDEFPTRDDVLDLLFVAVLAGFIGARLAYVIENGEWYYFHPFHIFAVWEGGLIFYGGVLGAVSVLLIFMRQKKIPIRRALDFLSPYVALTQAFGRIGCFLNGCCRGKACFLPWAVRFPGASEPVHPTQLYESVFVFSLFIFLNVRYPRKRFDGEITAFYFLIYSAGRFFLEFLRDTVFVWAYFTVNQWISILIFLAAFFYLLKNYRKRKNLA